MQYLEIIVSTSGAEDSESYTPYGPLDGRERVPYDGHYAVFDTVTDIFAERYGPQFPALLGSSKVTGDDEQVVLRYDQVGRELLDAVEAESSFELDGYRFSGRWVSEAEFATLFAHQENE